MSVVGQPPDADALLLAAAGRACARGVGDLPGVRRVFRATSRLSRWFGGPVTEFVRRGDVVCAVLTVGIDRHQSGAWTTGLIEAFVRARLGEHGYTVGDVRVRVALLT